jgi:hypothetical protein
MPVGLPPGIILIGAFPPVSASSGSTAPPVAPGAPAQPGAPAPLPPPPPPIRPPMPAPVVLPGPRQAPTPVPTPPTLPTAPTVPVSPPTVPELPTPIFSPGFPVSPPPTGSCPPPPNDAYIMCLTYCDPSGKQWYLPAYMTPPTGWTLYSSLCVPILASSFSATNPQPLTTGELCAATSPAPVAPPPPSCPPPTCMPICPSPPPPPPPPPPPAQCADCSIAYLSWKHPQFVLAERSAQKTDFDVLQDAIGLGLCCGDVKMPECSMPFLMRMVPNFVQAGQAQGLTDDQILTAAVNVGLCANIPPTSPLGETAVTQLAPGSAAVLESEFDPPFAGVGAPFTPTKIDASGNEFCWGTWVLPDPPAAIANIPLADADCLRGWERAVWSIAAAFGEGVSQTCQCDGTDLISAIGIELNKIWNQNTWWSKIVYYVGSGLLWYVRTSSCNLTQISNWIGALTKCNDQTQIAVVLAALMEGVLEKWVWTLPQPLQNAISTAVNIACPSETISPAEANALLATNFVSDKDWLCIQKRFGQIPEFQKRVVDSARSRPTAEDYLLLRRKGVLKETDFVEEMSHLGWTDTTQLDYWRKAQEWVPSPTDAIEWMLKDVQDQQIQETFLLNAEFQQKYAGHVKEAFDWNGISKTDADNIWRAHWRNMAPHVLYELHKRLRPGWSQSLSDAEVVELVNAIAPRKGPQVTPQILQTRPCSNGFPVPTYLDELLQGAKSGDCPYAYPITYALEANQTASVARQWLESLVTTGYHVSEALGQADYPPFWRQRLLAVSYNVLTRVDVRRAFETGQLTKEQTLAKFQDRGYSPGDSVVLFGFYRQAAVQLHSRRPIASQWVKTGFDTRLLEQGLIDQGMRPDMWDDVFSILETKRKILVQQQCMSHQQKRYNRGLIDDNGATAALVALGIEAQQIGAILQQWRCIKAAIPKHETAQEICKEFKAGLIGGNAAARLLRGLGYTAIQARRILSLCYLSPTPKGLRHVPKPGSKEAAAMEKELNT